MIYDKNGIIIKLNTKSVIEFLENKDVPLIIYGNDILKGEAKFTIDILLKKGIKIEALGDELIQNHHSLYEEIPIYSIEELGKKYSKQNSIIWLTIADKEKRKNIVQLCHKNGFYKNILNVDIMNPVSERYYYDFDENLPMVFIGDDRVYNKSEEYCAENKEIHIVDISKSNILRDIQKLIKEGKKYNWIICKDDEWSDIINVLHKEGIVENIYRYIRGIYGKFNEQKYEFLQSQIRKILYNEIGFVNTCYQLINAEYKEVYKKICKDFIGRFVYHIFKEGEILKLLDSFIDDSVNQFEFKFSTGGMNTISLTEYYNFLKFIRLHLVVCKEHLKNLEYNIEQNYILVEIDRGGENE